LIQISNYSNCNIYEQCILYTNVDTSGCKYATLLLKFVTQYVRLMSHKNYFDVWKISNSGIHKIIEN